MRLMSQVLMWRGRIAEPRIVRDVHQQRRVARESQLLGAVRVFVADRRRERLPRSSQRPLIVACPARNREYGRFMSFQPVTHCGRHWKELAERHEAALVVPLLRVAGDQATIELK